MDKLSKEQYNQEPVFYCAHCLSLDIELTDSEDSNSLSFCGQCGATDIKSTDIHTWEQMYEERYGEKYLKL